MGDLEVMRRHLADKPDDFAGRMAFADLVQESGDELTACVVRAQAQHDLPFDPEPKPARDIDLAALAGDYDWQEVFGQGTGGNCDRKTDACPPGAAVDLSPPDISEVAEVLAAVNGENDGDDWVGLFRMRDGRIVVASGGCDYTGWD